MELLNKSLYQCLKDAAEEERDRTYLFNERRSYSFLQTFNESVAIANDLYKFGIKDGSLVALRITRSLDSVLIFFALQILGAVTALIDPHKKVGQSIQECNENFNPQFVITNEGHTMDISANGGWKIKDCASGLAVNLTVSYPARREAELFNVNTDGTKPAIMAFTSGSTGEYKAVVHSRFSFTSDIFEVYKRYSYSKDNTVIDVLPLCYLYAMALLVFPSIAARFKVFIPESIKPEIILGYIGKYNVDYILGVPSYYKRLAEAAYSPICKPILGMISGAPCPKEDFAFIEDKLKIKLIPSYGMSETLNITSNTADTPYEKRISSVGKILPFRDVIVTDSNGNRLGGNEVGEICVKSPMLMLGYYNSEEATAKIKDADGYLHTGDLGYIGDGNYLYITGRKKDIIIRNGKNLSAIGIEQNLLRAGCFAEVAVVGIRDEKDGEVPCVAVVPKDGVKPDKEQLLEKIKTVLHKNELPKRIVILDKLPLLPNGKIDKQTIKKLFYDC